MLYWLKMLIPWQPSPTVVIATLIVAVLYFRGQRRFPVSFWRKFSFWTGLLLVYLALHSRLDYYAEREFFVHRIQHVILHHLGPMLIALSWPGPTLRAGIPVSWRTRLLNPFLSSAPVRGFLSVVMSPVMAAILFVGLIWIWLIPSVHFYAMLDIRLYRIMNWSMVLDGFLFWCLVLDPRSSPPARISPGLRMLLLGAVIPPQVISGAFITLSTEQLYPLYALCGRAFAGISGHTDQTLGGLILWVPSTMMSLIGIMIVMNWSYRLSLKAERHTPRESLSPTYSPPRQSQARQPGEPLVQNDSTAEAD